MSPSPISIFAFFGLIFCVIGLSVGVPAYHRATVTDVEKEARKKMLFLGGGFGGGGVLCLIIFTILALR